MVTIKFTIGAKTATFTTTGGHPVSVEIGDFITLTASTTLNTILADIIVFIAVQ
ncbi:hypothetical protein [uncultured Methylobacterium sp.]|uniref:hypothetical protein n=1 Tax=uncultured Methylobacterium sp. TaxID=157278 RepID=UPI0035CB6CB8